MNVDREKRIVEQMIRLYCRKKEGNKELCPICEELIVYASSRLDRCPYGDKKQACKNCPIHCYKPEMRRRIRKVMRYAGPRMIFYSPVAAIRHLWGK